MAVSPSQELMRSGRSSPPGTEYHRGRTLGSDEGVVGVPYLVLLVVAVVVVVLVMRAAGAPARGTEQRRRTAPTAAAAATRPLAPDDDPEFLRELERRTRRDDGSPA